MNEKPGTFNLKTAVGTSRRNCLLFLLRNAPERLVCANEQLTV